MIMTTSLQFQDLKTQQEELLKILLQSEDIKLILDNAEKLNLPNWYLAAGAVYQTIWNYIANTNTEIKDFDVIYFDGSDLSEEKEKSLESQLQTEINNSKIEIDLKNEASVQLWYKKQTGIEMNEPYKNIEDAISNFPTTCSCIGITKRNGEYKLFAPYGLSDIFGMIVRANKKQITKEIYDTKCEKWKKKWPQLTIIDWNK